MDMRRRQPHSDVGMKPPGTSRIPPSQPRGAPPLRHPASVHHDPSQYATDVDEDDELRAALESLRKSPLQAELETAVLIAHRQVASLQTLGGAAVGAEIFASHFASVADEFRQFAAKRAGRRREEGKKRKYKDRDDVRGRTQRKETAKGPDPGEWAVAVREASPSFSDESSEYSSIEDPTKTRRIEDGGGFQHNNEDWPSDYTQSAGGDARRAAGPLHTGRGAGVEPRTLQRSATGRGAPMALNPPDSLRPPTHATNDPYPKRPRIIHHPQTQPGCTPPASRPVVTPPVLTPPPPSTSAWGSRTGPSSRTNTAARPPGHLTL
eukprot:Hpha_TRINITY_DN15180_c2_g11::TRINITY_DN15180_c2_g11_i1::g.127886::m.127886